MGRRTNQRHYQRKTYKNVDAWVQENTAASSEAQAEFYCGTPRIAVDHPVIQPEVAERAIAKAEQTNPYLIAYQQPEIFQGEAIDPVHTVFDMCHLVEFVKRRYIENARMLQVYNSRLLDIQHEIEMLPPKNAPKGYRVYKEQRDILLRRRVAKDENAVLEPLKELIDKNPAVFAAMSEALNQIQHIDKGRELRRYSYRAPELIKKENDHE